MSRDLRERRRHLDAVRGAFAPGAPVPSGLAPAVVVDGNVLGRQTPESLAGKVEELT